MLGATWSLSYYLDNVFVIKVLETSSIVSDKTLWVDMTRLGEMVLEEEKLKWIRWMVNCSWQISLIKRGTSTFKMVKVLETSKLRN